MCHKKVVPRYLGTIIFIRSKKIANLQLIIMIEHVKKHFPSLLKNKNGKKLSFFLFLTKQV